MTPRQAQRAQTTQRKKLAGLVAGLIALVLVVGGIFLFNKLTGHDDGAAAASNSTKSSAKASTSAKSSTKPTAASSAAANNPSKLPAVKASALPQEAQQTLALIAKGGPYPYDRDGINFGNFEGVLPKKSSGYYKEYTVKTLGSSDRGARRVIVSDGGEKYYTDDHYASFSFIQENQ